MSSKNRKEQFAEDTNSIGNTFWEVSMSNAPAFRSAENTVVTTTADHEEAPEPAETAVTISGLDTSQSEERPRAVVTPISELSPEERRRQIKMTLRNNPDARIVAKVYSDEDDDAEEAPRTRTLRVSELKGDASKISVSAQEAREAATRPESAPRDGEQEVSMEDKVEAILKEMEAIEKAIKNEDKSPEQLRTERKQKIGRVVMKIAEILGGAVAGAGATAALGALASMI